MNITCVQVQVITQEGTAGVVRATFLLDGLVVLNNITLALDEANGTAEIGIPESPVEGGALAPVLAFQTPFARKAFCALLGKAVAEFSLNLAVMNSAAEKFQSLSQAIDTLSATVSDNTRELLAKSAPPEE